MEETTRLAEALQPGARDALFFQGPQPGGDGIRHIGGDGLRPFGADGFLRLWRHVHVVPRWQGDTNFMTVTAGMRIVPEELSATLARLMNAFVGSGRKGELRKQKLDASKLPDYQVMRRYLGSAGIVLSSEPNGWFAKGFTLTKEQ